MSLDKLFNLTDLFLTSRNLYSPPSRTGIRMDPGDIQEHFADGILSQSLRRLPSFLFHFSFPSLSPSRLLRTKYHPQKEKSKKQKCRVPGLFMAMPTENLGTCSSWPSTPRRFSFLPSDMHLSTGIGDGVSK